MFHFWQALRSHAAWLHWEIRQHVEILGRRHDCIAVGSSGLTLPRQREYMRGTVAAAVTLSVVACFWMIFESGVVALSLTTTEWHCHRSCSWKASDFLLGIWLLGPKCCAKGMGRPASPTAWSSARPLQSAPYRPSAQICLAACPACWQCAKASRTRSTEHTWLKLDQCFFAQNHA